MGGAYARVLGALGVGLGLLGCADGGSTPARPMTTAGDESSTGVVTTFDPTTTIDPSTTGAPTTTGVDTSGDTTTADGSSDSSSTDGATEDSSGSSGGDRAPTVDSTTPGDLLSGVSAAASIDVTFSEAMDAATLTTNTADTTCSGSIQVSADGFGSCVAMAGAPTSADDQTFTVTPAAGLQSATTYQIRVLATAIDAGGTPMDADFTTGTGFTVRYFHTIAIDGVNDFEPGETFTTSTPGTSGYVAWDDTYLYLGMDDPQLAADSTQVWQVSYLGGAMGTTTGVNYNTQQPQLPFDARWHLQWRADDTFGLALEWTGAAWQNAGFTLGGADVDTAGSFLEMRVAWADLGSPMYLDLHMGVLREENLAELTWAAVPDGSYADGYDPDYSQFFQFNLQGSTLPADTPPM